MKLKLKKKTNETKLFELILAQVLKIQVRFVTQPFLINESLEMKWTIFENLKFENVVMTF